VAEPGPRAPAGWYDDPGRPGVRLYWTGEAWDDPPATAQDGPAWVGPADLAPGIVPCDECSGQAQTLHALPDGNRPERVVLACANHDPGGEWWDLTEIDGLHRAVQNASAFEQLRPGISAALRGVQREAATRVDGQPTGTPTVVTGPRIWPAGLMLAVGAVGMWFANTYKPTLSNQLGLNGNTFVLKPGSYHLIVIVSIVLLVVGGIRLVMALRR
jgi:hypothetical protein